MEQHNQRLHTKLDKIIPTYRSCQLLPRCGITGPLQIQLFSYALQPDWAPLRSRAELDMKLKELALSAQSCNRVVAWMIVNNGRTFTMKLELDHFFVMVDPEGKVADLLVALGMEESFSRDHPGQGTSNRRFELSNSIFEFLWVRDADEANNGPGKRLIFVERSKQSDSSPFGIILNRKDDAEHNMPFEGWTYQPDYFEPPMAFHVGINSGSLLEPLCIYAPFMKPPERKIEDGIFRSLSSVRITTTVNPLSDVIDVTNAADRLSVVSGEQHLMEVTLDDNRQGLSKDFRPDIPVVINW